MPNPLKHSDIKHYSTKYYLNAPRAPENRALLRHTESITASVKSTPPRVKVA